MKLVRILKKYGITGFRGEKYSFVKSFRKQISHCSINLIPNIFGPSVWKFLSKLNGSHPFSGERCSLSK